MGGKEGALDDTVASDTVVSSAEAASSVLETEGTSGLAVREVLSSRWEILGLIGSGGMGTVYRAHDRELDDVVALKILKHEVVGSQGIDRFRREVKLARKVTHKNVARVFDLGEDAGRRFLTMELVEGESLRARLDRRGALSVAAAVDVGMALCRGLEAAHEVGVVHRDLKPDNVIVSKGERIVITDFGIAASLDARGGGHQTAAFMGTPHYMAPEQVDAKRPVDARSDLYALGAVLFELLTGKPPFGGETPLGIAVARLTEAPPDPRARRPDLPEALSLLVLRCLERDPDARWSSAQEVEGALLAILGTVGRAQPSAAPPAVDVGPTISPKAVASGAPFSPSTRLHRRAVRIAVLPIANQGPESQAYLADGITDDLIDALSTVQGLQVSARGAAARFEGRRDLDLRAVGQDLGVELLVQSSLRPRGETEVELAVRLVSARDGIQLWARRFRASRGDVLGINDEVATAVAEAVMIRAPQAERRLSDPVIVDLYLRARAKYRDLWVTSADDAVALFEQALSMAPDEPLLVAGHALALARKSFFAEEALPSADLASRRAVALAPSLGEAHLALASASLQRGEALDAYNSVCEALRLAPSLADAYQLQGRILSETGPADAALRAFDFALELDPTSSATRRERTRILALLGRWEDAERALDAPASNAVDMISVAMTRLRLNVWRGDLEGMGAVKRELDSKREQILQVAPGFHAFLDIIGDAIGGHRPVDPERLVRILPQADVGQRVRRSLFMQQLAAETNVLFGNPGHAFMLVERVVEGGLLDLLWMDLCPRMAPLHADPRWAVLREKVERRVAPVRELVARTGGGRG
jgi:serine/threonine-protein kinase